MLKHHNSHSFTKINNYELFQVILYYSRNDLHVSYTDRQLKKKNVPTTVQQDFMVRARLTNTLEFNAKV